MKTLYEKIVNYLKTNNVQYEEYRHIPVRTSEEAAKIRNTSLDEGAKALIMITETEPVMVVVPGDMRVDTEKLKSKFGFKKLKMCPSDFAETLSGAEVGGIPPFANLFVTPLQTYASKKIEEKEYIVFNAGDRGISIKIPGETWLKLLQPELF